MKWSLLLLSERTSFDCSSQWLQSLTLSVISLKSRMPLCKVITSGFVIQMGHGSISWRSSNQATVSASTAEAEYFVACKVSREAQYVYRLSQQLLLKPTAIHIGVDNESATFMTEDMGFISHYQPNGPNTSMWPITSSERM